jgi:hypothetical protein
MADEAERLRAEHKAWKAEQGELERAARERAEAEAQAIVAGAMGLVPQLQNGLDRAKGFVAVDEMLREVLMTRLVRGKHLTVKYVASPTGRMALEWVVTCARLDEPRVVLLCNDDKIMTDIGTSNRWGGQVNRGVVVRFVLKLHKTEGEHVLDSVGFEVHIPTERQWADAVEAVEPVTEAPAAVDPATAMEREIDAQLTQTFTLLKKKKSAYEALDTSGIATSDEDAEEYKAKIDGVIAKVGDKYEE